MTYAITYQYLTFQHPFSLLVQCAAHCLSSPIEILPQKALK